VCVAPEFLITPLVVELIVQHVVQQVVQHVVQHVVRCLPMSNRQNVLPQRLVEKLPRHRSRPDSIYLDCFSGKQNASWYVASGLFRRKTSSRARFTKYLATYHYVEFIARSAYDGDWRRAKISLRNIVSKFSYTISDDLTILPVSRS